MTVQVGSQTNVPAPGDPIISPWYQDTAAKIVHPFASVADRDAKWPTPPNGAQCMTLDSGALWVRRAGAWSPLGEVRAFADLAALKASGAPVGTSAVVLADPSWQTITRYASGWVGTKYDSYAGTTDATGKISLTVASFGLASVSWVVASGSMTFQTDIFNLLPFARVSGPNVEIYFLKITNAGLGAYDGNRAASVNIHIRGVLTP